MTKPRPALIPLTPQRLDKRIRNKKMQSNTGTVQSGTHPGCN